MLSGSNIRIVVIASLIAVGSIAIVTLGLCFSGIGVKVRVAGLYVNDATTKAQVQEFCGACHAVPRPELLPRNSWPEEITKAYGRYKDSGRDDLKVPVKAVLTNYFSRLAPLEVKVPEAPKTTAGHFKFRPDRFELPEGDNFAAVSFFNTVPPQSREGNGAADLLICGMENGRLNQFSWYDGKRSFFELGQVKSLAHVIACDFDRDGNQDFLVADLGMMNPSDGLHGSVVLFRSLGEARSFEAITILDGVARVADAEIADLDGDGDNDFVVTEFGWEKTGRLLWLETLSITNGRPETQLHVIDTRHGSIHAPVRDLDGDGDLDLIVLFSQEHETIVAFLNDGHGQFQPESLFQADTPSYGSSGLELVDLDQDGDFDILFTNGDTLDTLELQPFHGISWFENKGLMEFSHHRLAELPGAVRAVSGDLDGDGDVDIAAVAYCPPILRNQKRPKVLDTIIILEQKNFGHFERHSIEHSVTTEASTDAGHLAIATGDFDGDHRLDLAVGEFSPFNPKARLWFTIYWNQIALTK